MIGCLKRALQGLDGILFHIFVLQRTDLNQTELVPPPVAYCRKNLKHEAISADVNSIISLNFTVSDSSISFFVSAC